MIALALALAPALASDPIDAIVQAEMAKSKIPGVAVAVLRNGKPIKMKGYGFANLEHKVPVKPETVFQSGSVGKQFTSALALILANEGKLSLDDEIVKYLPEGKGKWEGIKVHHLMSHTSGLPDLPYWDMDLRKDYTEDELVKYKAGQEPPKFKPGIEWRYNNGGYVILGVLLSRAGGKFYGELLKEKLFGPLGMKTARVIDEADIIPNRAAGYQPSPTGLKNQAWVAPKFNTTADGALYLTLHDMVKWDAELYGGKVLTQAMLDQMWTPVNKFPLRPGDAATLNRGYGFGWFVLRDGKSLFVEHSGGWQGFTAYIGRKIDKRVSVIVFCNASNGPAEAIGHAVLARVAV